MSLQITGEVISVLEEKSGTGQNGEWRKQDFILETAGQYPAKICIGQWGERIDEFEVTVGETLTVHINLKSREYNDRWYTDVAAWKIEREGEVATGRGGATGGGNGTGQDAKEDDKSVDDDLPF